MHTSICLSEPNERNAVALTALFAPATMRRSVKTELSSADPRDAERIIRQFLEAAPDAIIVVKQDGTIALVNSQTERLFGYAREELLGQAIELLLPHRFREQHRAHRMVFAQAPRVRPMGVDLDLYGRRKDGSEFPVEVSLNPFEFEEGTWVISAIRDLTERRRIEAKARESAARYEALVESLDGVVWEVELPALRFTFVSRQAERMLGYPVRCWLEEPNFWADHVHPDDRDQAVSYCLTRTTAKENHDFKYRMLAVDGRVVWVHDLVTVLVEDGRPSKLRGLMVDITKHQRAEAALRESEQRFRTLVEQAADAFFLHDTDGRILDVNRRACESLGYGRDELLHLGVFDVTQDYSLDRAKEAWGQVQPGQFGTISGHHRRKDGTTFPVEVRWGCLEVEGQRLFLDLARDVTERQNSEAIREAMLNLGSKLSAALTPSEAARIIFAAADQLWDWDAGTLDLYSPAEDRVWAVMYLDTIDGAREEVPSDQVLLEPTPRMRRIMREGAELILRTPPLVQDSDAMMFGDTSRLSASILCAPIRWQGKSLGVLSIQSYTLHAFTESDLKSLQALADHCGGTIERIRTTEALRASEARFRAVIETEPECVKIVTVDGVLAQMNTAGLAMLEVDSLEQARSCSLVEWVAPEHRADFRCLHEHVMRGESGTLEFEVIGAKGTRRWLETRAAPLRDERGQEDESDLRNLARLVLERFGYTVLEARDGPSALQIWRRSKASIRLLLTDMIMPEGMTGRALAEKLRAERPDLPVIYSSSYSAEIFGHGMTLQAGAKFLQKPYHPLELARAVRQGLDALN